MYRILEAETLTRLEQLVDEWIGSGWKLAGGVTFSQGRWLQAVGKHGAFK